MIEKDVEIQANGNKLSASVCLPANDGRFPVVLMVHGSGPLDRNENMPGQKLDIFNSIAHYLADEGIASLRYDKRGCGASTGNYKTAGHFDHIADASAWVEYIESYDYFLNDHIYALGHSEGAIIVPQLSLKRRSIAGIILLAPFVQPIDSILRQQAAHIKEAINDMEGVRGLCFRLFVKLTGDVVSSQNQLIEKVKASTTPTIRYKYKKIESKWLRELFKIDPPHIFRQVTCPMLLIGGEKDIQCDPADVDRIAKIGQCDVDKHVIHNLTHILRVDDGKHTIFRYRELMKKPVERRVLELISKWLKQQTGKSGGG